MPAVCDNCTTIFPSGLEIQQGRAFFIDNKSGPCPYCGGWGHIPDGEFEFFDNIIQVLNAPNRTLSELRSLAKLLEQIKRTPGLKPEEAAKEIEKEIPELQNFISQFQNIDYKFWISILLSTIYFLIPYLSNDEIKQEVEPEKIIDHIYHSNVKVTPLTPIVVNKIGRNEPCPCDSGIKYKRCHGLK